MPPSSPTFETHIVKFCTSRHGFGEQDSEADAEPPVATPWVIEMTAATPMA
jgi:hypothetical protein